MKKKGLETADWRNRKEYEDDIYYYKADIARNERVIAESKNVAGQSTINIKSKAKIKKTAKSAVFILKVSINVLDKTKICAIYMI